MIVETTYLGYAAVSVALTVWVGRTLHKNGRRFLVDTFEDESLADSVNHLLVVGFYLVNFGFVALALKMADPLDTSRGAIEALSGKIGTVSLVLGAMHLFNVYVFHRIRRHARLATLPPPVLPNGFTRDLSEPVAARG